MNQCLEYFTVTSLKRNRLIVAEPAAPATCSRSIGNQLPIIAKTVGECCYQENQAMKFQCRIEALSIRDKATRAPRNGCAFIDLTLEGVTGDVHFGFTRPADGRDRGIVRGTPVRNWRQWSAVSVEELQKIAKTMGLECLDPCLLSANLTFSGVENFTLLPRGTEIRFEGGAILTVEQENAPCAGPGKEIATLFPGKQPYEFVKAAQHLRGLVGVVYRAGVVQVGESAEIVCPTTASSLPAL